MIIDVVVRDVDEVKLLCSLHEVMISDEVVVSYVRDRLLQMQLPKKKKDTLFRICLTKTHTSKI